MTFVKGVSGNPSGKRKDPIVKRTITELAREMSLEALQTLGKVMRDPKATSTARALAANHILDRAYGKAPQAVGVVMGPSKRPEDFTDAELAAIIAGQVERLGQEQKQIEAVAIEDELPTSGHGDSAGTEHDDALTH